MKTVGLILVGLVLFVIAVNLIWWVAPILGDPGVYRPLFGILMVVIASAAYRQTRDGG